MLKSFYITTTLPYVNAEPHIGFAMEIIRADIIARWKRIQGYEVFFNTGTDEHGQKILRAAEGAGKEPKRYVDEYAAKFEDLKKALNLSYDNFVRTTDERHIASAQEFWRRVKEKGFIYKKNYKTKYCVGCELEKTDSELEGGRCPLHPNLDLEIIEEENYFFKFSAFADKLLDLYAKNPRIVIPDFRLNEMKEFVKRGLNDFSISRLKSKMPWGVPVPDDPDHVMYVWFDALVNYISALGWPADEKKFKQFWAEGEPTQYCGKDNTRFQSVMWQAMLMASDLPPSAHIVVNGFVNSGGQKMSKSLGNVANPYELVKEYGTDTLRYYVSRELNPFEDSDYTPEKFQEAYNANLANGLGNLASRILTMAEKYKVSYVDSVVDYQDQNLENFDIKKYMDSIWEQIQNSDKKIQDEEPFKLFKTDPEKAKGIVSDLCADLSVIAKKLLPVMPETAGKILSYLKEAKKPETPLFQRKD